jgi:hypothetical protein
MTSLEQNFDELKGNVHLEEVAGDGERALTEEQKEFIKKEKRVVRKLDTYITPVMLLLMLISYLDRGNIGFAATQGMTKDIGLTGNQLSVSAGQACPISDSDLSRPRYPSSISHTFFRK